MTLNAKPVVDRGAVVEHQPLVPKVPGSNPVMSQFCLWNFSKQIDCFAIDVK